MVLRVKNIYISGTPAPEGATVWDPDSYERAVRANIDLISDSLVGPIVLRYATFGERLVIAPSAHSHRGRVPRAYAQPDESGRLRVFFTPAHWVGPDASGQIIDGQEPLRSDEVLLHEIAHCLQARFGRRVDVEGPTADDLSPVDERRAVTLTNMYRSERGRPLRGPYGDTFWMSENGTAGVMYRLTGHAGFIGYRTLRQVQRSPGDVRQAEAAAYWQRFLAKFRSDYPGLCATLAIIPRDFCPYNPFDRGSQESQLLYVPSDWRWGSGVEDPGNRA